MLSVVQSQGQYAVFLQKLFSGIQLRQRKINTWIDQQTKIIENTYRLYSKLINKCRHTEKKEANQKRVNWVWIHYKVWTMDLHVIIVYISIYKSTDKRDLQSYITQILPLFAPFQCSQILNHRHDLGAKESYDCVE